LLSSWIPLAEPFSFQVTVVYSQDTTPAIIAPTFPPSAPAVGNAPGALTVGLEAADSFSFEVARQDEVRQTALDHVFAEDFREVAEPLAFISYRREGGAELARLIKLGLAGRGVRGFLDVDDLGPSPFGAQLLDTIRKAPHFVVVLTPGCLDR